MSLVDPSGRPVSTKPDHTRDIAALAHQCRVLQEGMFHTNILLEFVVSQVNEKLRDSEGLSPIDITKFEKFAKARTLEIQAMLQEHQKQAQPRVPVNE